MKENELDQYLEIIKTVLLNSAVTINKWREKFVLEVFVLYLIIPGRIYFRRKLDRLGNAWHTGKPLGESRISWCQDRVFHISECPLRESGGNGNKKNVLSGTTE